MLILSAKAFTVQGTVVIHLYQPTHVTEIGSRAQAVTFLFLPVKHIGGEFYVHVTVHRNKFLYNKTNQMHQFPKFTPA
jgi:hypothetical protein